MSKKGYVGMTSDEQARKDHWRNQHSNVDATWRVRARNLTYDQALEKEEKIAEAENRDFSGGGQRESGAVYIVYTFDY